jgi:hypothetical protein
MVILSQETEALEACARVAGVLPEPQRRRDQSPAAIAARRESLDWVGAEIAAMTTIDDPRSPREIMDDFNALYF